MLSFRDAFLIPFVSAQPVLIRPIVATTIWLLQRAPQSDWPCSVPGTVSRGGAALSARGGEQMQLPGASHRGLNIVWGEKTGTGTRAAGMLLGGEEP